MINQLQRRWEENPLLLIMGVAVFFRLLAVIFAKGWGMIDDHFIVIESAQSWVDGKDYNSWLPGSSDNHGPTGHNFFYPGLHYLLFSFFNMIHVHDPQLKMLIVRLLHGAWSLLTVYFGYKITEKIADRKSARMAGLLLAVYWFMPWLSVHNLVEMSCVPLLIIAVWFIISREDNPGLSAVYFLAGLFLGLAFNIRPQTILFSAGLLLAIIIRGRWKEGFACAAGLLIPIILIQGTIDFFIWGKPFVEIIAYFTVNYHDSGCYVTLPWYNYFLVIFGILLPPVSFFLFFGFLRTWKKFLLIFLPVVLFFIFHSSFPNKQERFILPILPFIIITGIAGWNNFIGESTFWKKRIRLLSSGWVFFWIINLVLVTVLSMAYSKRARVETMTYLSNYSGIRALLVADTEDSPELFPRFYLQQWPTMYDELRENESTSSMMNRVSKFPGAAHPQFILFTGDHVSPEQVISARKYFPYIVYETTIEPGFIDKTIHWMNPINKNRKVYIYRNTLFYPTKFNESD